jgi:hypothetical protein
MPRATIKYQKAILLMSQLAEESTTTSHARAARAGTRRIYRDLSQAGYRWDTHTQTWKPK